MGRTTPTAGSTARKSRGKKPAQVAGSILGPASGGNASAQSKQNGHLISELSRSFFELLLTHRNHYIGVISEEKFAPMQAHVLNYIGEHPCTMREIAESALLEPSNLTGIIDKLEARGLVTRREATNDRRSKIVALTPAGTVMRNRIYTRFCEPAPWMLALTTQDQQSLFSIVRKAIDYEKSHESPPSSRSARLRAEAIADAPPAPNRTKSSRSRSK